MEIPSLHRNIKTGTLLSNDKITKKLLDEYKLQLSIHTKLQCDIINKIVDQYLDSRILCGSCNKRQDSYNLLSSCDNCHTQFCLFCNHLDITFVIYIPCNVRNCYSCSSGLVCDNETSKTYCISCKDKLDINNNTTKKCV